MKLLPAIYILALHLYRRKHVYMGITIGFWVAWTGSGSTITNKSSPVFKMSITNTNRHIDSATTYSHVSSSTPASVISSNNYIDSKHVNDDLSLRVDVLSHSRDSTEAIRLNGTVRILCWALTRAETYYSKAAIVRKTWGKHCQTLLLFSSHTNYTIPTVALNISNGRQRLYEKTIAAFRYVYEHHINDADYFLKADDDTFVILENLRYFLSAHDPEIPAWFGRQFRWYVYKRYMSGGAGYVLSKGAVKQLYNEGPKIDLCRRPQDAEDVGLGLCFQQLRIPGISDADILGKPRMHYLNAADFLTDQLPFWVDLNDVLGAKRGPKNMSRYSISYHYIDGELNTHVTMYFYVYRLKVFGQGTQRAYLNYFNTK